jgi:hypothetical protein
MVAGNLLADVSRRNFLGLGLTPPEWFTLQEEKHPQRAIPGAVKAMIVDTMGNRVQVSWDKESWLYAKSC